jgi:undecaprenyl diphosphate synthase
MQKNSMQCIGFIMDGNRRYAKERGLQTLEGHKKGGEVFAESIRWVRDAGIAHAVYYAFSTENWRRSDEEVGYLMKLFREWLQKLEQELGETADKRSIKIRIVGRREDFTADLQQQMERLEEMNREEEITTTIWIALSYGGRAEIVAAVNEAVARGDVVNEESFERLLWTAEMPDPDLIVRTGGDHRLSNFMTWKSVYSELLFIDKYWPALTKDDFDGILMQYGIRERRKGV